MKRKPNKPTVKVEEPAYMSYDTFVLLKNFLEGEDKRLHREAVTATLMLTEIKFDGKTVNAVKKDAFPQVSTARDTVWNHYLEQMALNNRRKKELYHAFSKGASPKVIEGGFFK